MSYSSDLRERFYRLGRSYPGFDEVLTQALFALYTKEHVLWYSAPGRAKSVVARNIFGMFTGAPMFPIQLTRETGKDEIFGNVVVEELMKGRELYNLEGGIAKATFSYLDEIMDASDFVLRSMLNVLNERIFSSKDMGTINCPLHTVIATTNYIRQREATAAVLDRMMCKATLKGIDGLTDCMRAGQTYLGFKGKRLASLPPLSYEGLKELADLVQTPEEDGGIVISPGMRMLHVLLVHEFQRQRRERVTQQWHEQNPDAVDAPTEEELAQMGLVDVSPRTLVKLHDFTRAAAVLNDRREVVPADNQAIGYGLIVVGDGSGDEEIWHNACSTYLKNLTGKNLESLEDLGKIADAVGQVRSERDEVTRLQLQLGGKVHEFSALTARNLVDIVTRNGHPSLALAKDMLRQEIADLTAAPAGMGFNLLRGWN